MIIKTRGICLSSRPYAETSVIAQVFTEAKGLQSYIISGVRSSKPRVPAALLQPGTLLDMVVYWKENADLFRTKELRPYLTYERIPFDVVRGAVALFACEVLYKALRESEPAPELYAFAESYLAHLDQPGISLQLFPLFFLLRIAGFLGLEPQTPDFGQPWFFDHSSGEVLPEPPAHGRFASPESSALLLELLSKDTEEIVEAAPVSRTARTGAINALIDYLRSHTEGFNNLHSYRILTEVFRS